MIKYYPEFSSKERAEISFYPTGMAFRFNMEEPPKMDRSLFALNSMKNNGRPFQRGFQDFIKALNDQNVSYILMGRMAVIIHGQARVTGGMDIWVKPIEENYQKNSKHFNDLGYRFLI